MTSTLSTPRQITLGKIETDTLHWCGLIESLLSAFNRSESVSPSLDRKMEELRHKRDTVLTKLEVMKRHRSSRWQVARNELETALADLRSAWRSVIATLDRESQKL